MQNYGLLFRIIVLGHMYFILWSSLGHRAQLLCMRFAERIQGLLDEAFEDHHPLLGVGAVSVPVDLDQGNMLVRVVPWIRGRMFSLIHKPSGYEWMEGRMEYGGYEDITGVDLQSSANPEDFKVVKYVYKHPGLELICAVLIHLCVSLDIISFGG